MNKANHGANLGDSKKDIVVHGLWFKSCGPSHSSLEKKKKKLAIPNLALASEGNGLH